MRILQVRNLISFENNSLFYLNKVLRSLLLSPVGSKMTNDSVCEILQSCFRICFETRLSGKEIFYEKTKRSFFLYSELLRKTSEHVLIDMVQLLFARLPQFKDDATPSTLTKRVKQKQQKKSKESIII
jgi:brefeldin A-resistance guanine nucleotide exchange factor 1